MEAHGVRLETYAGIVTALAEGISLEDVLKQENVDAEVYADAEFELRNRMSQEPAVMEAFRQHCATAEDTLSRKVAPLDNDAAAWVAFNSAMTSSGDALTFLSDLGLNANDLSRLQRQWRKRAESSKETKQALADAAKKPGAAPTKIDTTPVALKRFPWSPGAEPQAAAAPTSSAAAPASSSSPLLVREGGLLPVERDADLYASVLVAIELLPNSREALLARVGVKEAGFSGLVESWEKRFQYDVELRVGFKLRMGEQRSALRALLAGAKLEVA
ncbi:MAG: hypothetical protein U0271_14320 [Polyangiaceae bacterium]